MITHSNEQQLDPAVAPAASDEAAPQEPHRQFALKHEDCFVVADSYGDIRGAGDGFFRDDTRVLSRFRLFVGGTMPSLLGASLSQDNILFNANLTNRAVLAPDGDKIPEGVVHIERTRFIWQNRMFERIGLTNYSSRSVAMPLRLDFGADFRDMFEVRGSTRNRRGHSYDAVLGETYVAFRYDGLDGVTRASVISFSENSQALFPDHIEFALVIRERECRSLYIEVGDSDIAPSRNRFRAAAARARWAMRAKRQHGATIFSSGRVFNNWLSRAQADLALLTTDLETGPYPYAGIPWFSTAFGRDGVVSALQMLWLNPRLARGVLAFLARHQSTEVFPFGDAEPGKIMHETRKGEMAVLRELPFGRYYGGVDTTPLYVCLAASYADRTGDTEFVDQLWPSLCAAAAWMEDVGARNGLGFVTYNRASTSGLLNQGWKDSFDAIFHADGRIPPGPIALVEVQGYAFAAYKGLAALAVRRGDNLKAAHWADLAERVRASVEEHFWMEDRSFYALALDGEGKQCAVRTSNAGHLLYVGLPGQERAEAVARQLLSAQFHSGWGVRTLADDELAFNPMSYHNGSVWPHDTALCAAGFARYQERESVIRLMTGMFEAAVQFNMRLPELFCGFPRSAGDAPVAYPVACLPQAWSAGSAFMLMQACLGIRIDGWRNEIRVERPRLPIGIDSLVVRHLTVGGANVDIKFERFADRVVCYLDQRHEGLVPLIVSA